MPGPAGYSGTPLVRKLGIAEGTVVTAIGAPKNYAALLASLPPGAKISGRLAKAPAFVHLLDVAMGNYLDIGYHTKGWTRAMLVDSMVVLGGRARAQAEAYADRHAATPGQLATYYYGYRAIAAARDYAQRELGPKFRAPEFHYEVLRDGSITLSSMRSKIERWVASQQEVP